MKPQFKLLAFDIDGTLSSFAIFEFKPEIVEALISIPLEIHCAICSGRPLEYTLKKMEQVFAASPHPEKERARWKIITDNGSAGYFYNSKTKKYEQLFEILWPSAKIQKEMLAKNLKKKLGFWCRIVVREYTLVVVYPKWLYTFPKLVIRLSRYYHTRIEKFLKQMKLGKILMVKDSGLGNLIIPANSGKQQAVRKLAKHFKIQSKETLCVGDRPDPGGNDEDFLNGEFGLPYTVGQLSEKAKPVLDEHGKQLKGPQGVIALLKNSFANL